VYDSLCNTQRQLERVLLVQQKIRDPTPTEYPVDCADKPNVDHKLHIKTYTDILLLHYNYSCIMIFLDIGRIGLRPLSYWTH